MHFFFDLDGPILDVSNKFYETYAKILTDNNEEKLDKFLYWELKRNKTKESDIQQITNAQIPDFGARRKSIIELDLYQRFDLLQPCTEEVLKAAKTRGKVLLVTLRHSHAQLLKQLKRFGIVHFFDAILSSGAETNPKWEIKYNLVFSHFNGNIPQKSVFIGDTEADILAGKNMGSKTIGVLYGMRNYTHICNLNPDIIVASAKQIIQHITAR